MSLAEGEILPASPGTSWFDSHCHLQDVYLGRDESAEDADDGADAAKGPRTAALTDTLVRTLEAGVGAVVCVGTDPATSTQALAVARSAAAGELGDRVPDIWATAGLHPHQASSGVDELVGLVSASVSSGDPYLVAVGECGLDYHYDHSPHQAQMAAFADQIALAHRHRLALVIHARQAWDDLFSVLAAEGVPERTILHCFTGGPEEARRCLDAGMYVSFSGIVTFKNAVEVREAAAMCPLDRLLIETDSPFLTPVPHRGKPNEPAYVVLVGAAVAQARNMDPSELASITARNASTVFGLPQSRTSG